MTRVCRVHHHRGLTHPVAEGLLEQRLRLLQHLLGRTPAPRAWNHLFSDRPNLCLRIETTDGTPLAGRFADRSYAGGFPHEPDLYLEEEWSLDEDGNLAAPLGYPVYIPSGQIARMEVVPQQDEEM